MNKKGFTLVELLAVIVILALLALLASTAITKVVKDSKDDLSNVQISLIKSAAEAWGADHITSLPSAGTCGYITLEKLKNEGLIDSSVVNPANNEEFSNDLKIKISTVSGTAGKPIINYEVNPDSVSGCEQLGLICKLQSGTSKTTGAEYTCTLDTTRTFYVLGDNEDSTKIDLIMNMNYTDDTVPATMAWCDPNGANPSNNACNHDNLEPLVSHVQEVFGSDVTVSLPSYNQIYKAAGNKTSGLPAWLYDYLRNTTHPVSGLYGYWTSTPYASSADRAWNVFCDGSLNYDPVSSASYYGFRPVITISKSLMN